MGNTSTPLGIYSPFIELQFSTTLESRFEVLIRSGAGNSLEEEEVVGRGLLSVWAINTQESVPVTMR